MKHPLDPIDFESLTKIEGPLIRHIEQLWDEVKKIRHRLCNIEQKLENKMKWISLKDKTPEDDTWVLGINSDTKEGDYGEWIDSENGFCLPHCEYAQMKITHWMLFPECPRDEDE